MPPPAGIYRTATGYRVVASIGRGPGKRTEKAFPATTGIRALQRWQEDARRELRETAKAKKPGSLGDDVDALYLPAVAAMPTYKERERHIRLWVAALGPQRHRDTVSGVELRAILDRWHQGGWSRATCNRARTALMHLYSVLNGRSGYNPCRDVPRARERQKPPKPFSYPLFEQILTQVPDWAGYGRKPDPQLRRQMVARLRVMAYVGLPQAQIKQLVPTDLLEADRLVHIAGRQKGKGTDAVYLPLSARGLAALQDFFTCGAAGTFRNETLRDLFRAGAMQAGRPDLTPYDLRHLFGTTVLRLSKNRAATRDLMLHTDDRTTAGYVRAAIPIELRAALDGFDADVLDWRCGPKAAADEKPPVTH